MAQRFAASRAWGVGAVAIVLLALMGWITHVQVMTLSSSTGWVEHSGQVRLALERTLTLLKDAETGLRGYLVVPDDLLLEPYSEALPRLEESQRRLQRLIADNPVQVEAAADLSKLVQHAVEQMNETLAVARSATRDSQFPGNATREGKSRMDAVRAEITQMLAREDVLLATRLDRAARARTTASATAAGLALLSIALVVLILVVSQRSARRLHGSEQWLSTTLSSIGDGVIATDAEGNVRFLNSVAMDLTGWTLNESRGRPLDEVFRIIGEDTGTPMDNPVAKVLRSGLIIGLANHTLLIRRDGKRIPIVDSAAPIRDAQESIQGVVLVFRDDSQARAAETALRERIAEREQALRNLAETEQRLRLATEGLGTWDLDLITERAIWNAHMYQIMGVDPAVELTREARRSRALPEDMPLLEQAMAASRADRTPFQVEYRIARPNDPAIRWLEVTGRYFYDEAGTPTRVIGIAQDVSERHQLEDRLRQSQKLDALGTLAGGIAHDFNNILAVMRGSLLVAESELPPEHPAAPALAEMTRAWSRARDLVRQILTFGRQQEQDRHIMALESVIADALRLLRSTVPAGIEINFRAASNLPNVLADASQIHQVIMNLGINGAQAIGRKSGRIDVSLDALSVKPGTALSTTELLPGEYLYLRFADSGAGMTAEVREKIFEPFFTTKSVGSGTGLGLSVVRGIMKNHDGAITVYSEPDRGTQFHLYFPAIQGVVDAKVAEPAAPSLGTGQRILYLDDEPSLIALAEVLLARLGYTVRGFTEVSAALDAFNSAPEAFDLVLTDLSMPGTSGLEIAAKILERRPDIPVLLASGYIRPEDAAEARRIGIREIIWKPFTVNEIGEVIARVFAARRDTSAPPIGNP